MWSDAETPVDSLNVQHLVRAIVQLLDKPHLSPVTIGVYGDWGSGKSSVVLMLQEELGKIPRSEKTLCVDFNGWRFEGYDDAKSALMTTVLEELAERKGLLPEVRDKVKALAARINWLRVGKTATRYLLHGALAVATQGMSIVPSLGAEVAVAAKGATADGIVQTADQYIKDAAVAKKVHDTVREFEAEFKKILEDTKLERLVVIIDDLDRCNPTQIIDTLEAIRLFLAVPRTAFIIAADEMMVQHAAQLRFPGLTAQSESLGRDYLEKMVQIPVRVPPLGPRDIETYLNMLSLQLHLTDDEFRKACATLLERATNTIDFRVTSSNAAEVIGKPLTEEMKRDLALADQVRTVVAMSVDGNPRQIKRFMNAVRLRLIMADGRGVKLDPRVAAKLMLLEYFRPEAFRTIARWQSAHHGIAQELADIEVAEVGRATDEPSSELAADDSALRTKSTGTVPTAPGARAHERVAGTRSAESPADSGQQVRDNGSGVPVEYESWRKNEWMQAWIRTEPMLGTVDLGPYFYFARDRIAGGTAATQRMSPAAREVFSNLQSAGQVVREKAAQEARNLSSTDAVALLEMLIERTRLSETQTEASTPFQGLISLVAARPELATEFATALRSLPYAVFTAGTPNRIMALAEKMDTSNGAVLRAVVKEWQGQMENKSLARGASLALSDGA